MTTLKNYPSFQALDFLGRSFHRKVNINRRIKDDEQLKAELIKVDNYFKSHSKQRSIFIVKDSFTDAVTKMTAKYKTVELFKDCYMQCLDKESVNIMIPKDGGYLMVSTFDKKIFVYFFDKTGLLSYATMKEEQYDTLGCDYFPNVLPQFDNAEIRERLSSMAYSTIPFIYFKDNCEVNTEYVMGNSVSKSKSLDNKTNLNIIILDCHWFTELIRSVAFGVIGHFRWQPCGEGRQLRKLIWIADFEKEGYRRRATKEIVEKES